MKASVIQRLRAGQAWCQRHGTPYDWIGQVLADAAQELESQSGALWCQWSTRSGHIRIFVAGEMGAQEIDSLIELLKMQRSWIKEDSVSSLTPPASPPEPEQ